VSVFICFVKDQNWAVGWRWWDCELVPGWDVFVSYIFDSDVYYVVCFVSMPLRTEVVSVVEEMLEGL